MLADHLLNLVKNTSTSLSKDIVEALITGKNQEVKESKGELTFDVILKNLEIAKNNQTPVCQDTGLPTFFVQIGQNSNISKTELSKEIKKSIKEATKKGYLRPNAVDTLTGKNSGDNLGEDLPKIVFEDILDSNEIKIDLLLKGGGSENVSDQVSLPMETDFGLAGRDLEGVKKAVLQVVKNAKGKGCAPGVLGVHIGGDRAGGYLHAKKNLLRKIGQENDNEKLRELEAQIYEQANELGIGPMGFGGKTTILDVVASVSHRHPASFFVTVVYNCWAGRRGSIVLDTNGDLVENSFDQQGVLEQIDLNLKNVKRVDFPVSSSSEIKNLKVGDIVLVSGVIYTGRDMIHAHAVKNDLKQDISGSAIYHCGPVAFKNSNSEWEINAAGPTTSAREEIYQADFIKKTGVKAVIGKGGMGQKTLKSLQDNKAVYLHAIGGAAAFYAKSIKKVLDVDYLEEFGVPEAMWKLEVEDFLCVVTMDSHGKTLN